MTGPTARGRGLLATGLVALAVTVAAIVALVVLVPEPEPAPARGVGLLSDRVAPTEQAPMPDFSLAAFDGSGRVTAADFRGSPLVMNFWATWCAPCVDEMPALQRAADEGGGAFTLLGVNVEDDHADAEALADALAITYPLAIDPRGEFARDVGLFGMPTTLFVDGGGTIRYRHTGPLTGGQLRELLHEHLGVPL